MTTTIDIDSRDLAYTIDTYGMFTGESTDESESEYYRDEYNLTDDEWRSISFDYDHAEIVKALASSSIQLLDENLVQHGSGIVKAVDLRSTTSPKFYNYTTDSYIATWTVDVKKLENYIKADQAKYNSFEREHWYSVYDSHGTDNFKQEDYIVAMLDYYTQTEYSPEDYNMSMFEYESEAYYENMTLDQDSQKLIDSKKGSK